ncbi:MAG TPA: aminomethyltransferase family protein, partial [Thermohalobaculum sp.]|nr:aminomethyltransferase family protein [Thermohalobaculum sp.]
GEDRFWWGSAAAAEQHDRDWLMASKPQGVDLTSLTGSHTTLVVAGPRARDLLAAVSPRTDWSRDAFPWLSVCDCCIGHAGALAMSVSFSGELAWELHIPNEQLCAVHEILSEAGGAFGLGGFGLYATESMRIEKGYRHWKADLITEFDPHESGLGRFLNMDHDFPGRESLEEKAGQPPRKVFVTLEVHDDAAPAHAGDSLFDGRRVVGTVTSAAWGHRVGKNLAMAFVEPSFGAVGSALSIDILGRSIPATVAEPCLYDPANERLRG